MVYRPDRSSPSSGHRRPSSSYSRGQRIQAVRSICKVQLRVNPFLSLMPTTQRSSIYLHAMMRRAEKDAVRWCHLTHLFIAEASVHSSKPKTRVAELYRYFVSKRFINHSVIIDLAEKHDRHTFLCINSGNGHVTNDHLQAKNTSAGLAPRYVITTTLAEIKILYNFVLLPDTLVVRLIGSSFTFSFASSSCRIYKFIPKLTHN